MKYLGGKSRYGKKITEAILGDTDSRSLYVEPFLGGGNVAKVMTQHFDKSVLGDLDEDVVCYWKAIADGWVPDTVITEEQWRKLREQDGPSPLKSHAAFNASFGGKKWGGYARGNTNKGEPRNYADEGSRSDTKPGVREAFARAEIRHTSYIDIMDDLPVAGSVIYCDPPYVGTTKYAGSPSWTEESSEQFWDWCQQMTKRGANVYVSEYKIPDSVPHEVIFTASHVKSVGGGKGSTSRPRSVENVYKVLL